MKVQSRNVITSILISLVTCGLYGYYWAYKMGTEAVTVKDENDSGLLEAILMIFLPFVGFYMVEKKLAEGCAAKGIDHKDNAILYLILGLVFPIANYFMLQTELNKIAEA